MANRARVSVLVINLLTINIEAARKFDENIATIQDNAGGVYSISNKYENVDIFKFIGDKIKFLPVRWRHRRKKLRHLNITTESLAMKSMCRHRPLQDIRCTIKNYLLYHYQDHLYHSPIHFTIYHYTLYHCALSVGVGSQLQGQPSSDCQAESEKGLILSRVLMISRISSYLLPDTQEDVITTFETVYQNSCSLLKRKVCTVQNLTEYRTVRKETCPCTGSPLTNYKLKCQAIFKKECNVFYEKSLKGKDRPRFTEFLNLDCR